MLSYGDAQAELQQHRRHGSPSELMPRGWRLAVDPYARTLASFATSTEIVGPGLGELADHLDRLSDRKLKAFFKSFAPALAAELARSWRWGATQPYQTGMTRRPFRHRDPRRTHEARLEQLRSVLVLALQFPGKDLAFLTDWAPYLDPVAIGRLLASEISHGERSWVARLTDHAEGRVRTGGMGAHVTVGLLAADDPVGWRYLEDLLVRAQRQEGVRQAILEEVDLAHPAAFRRMLDVVLEHGLTRFAATVRAATVWFGENLDVRHERQLTGHLARVAQHLDADAGDGPAGAGPEDTLLHLWAIAFTDAGRAVHVASDVLRGGTANERLAAVRVLAALDLEEARAAAAAAFGDDDPRVVAAALTAWGTGDGYGWDPEPDSLGPGPTAVLLGLVGTARRGKQQIGILAPREVDHGPAVVADIAVGYGASSLDLVPAVAKASANGRAVRARRLARMPERNRAELLALVGDPADEPRRTAVEALGAVEWITADEAQGLERLLRRKSAPVRKACLGLLARQPGPDVAASVARLGAGSAEQKQAAEALARAAGLAQPDDTGALPVLTEVLGLDHARRTPSRRPRPAGDFAHLHRPIQVLVTSLYAWLDEHKDVEVTVHRWGGTEVQLLADVVWLGNAGPDGTLPLHEVIDPWWQRARPLLPGDGLELALLATLAPNARHLGQRQQTVPLSPTARAVLGAVPERYLDGASCGLAPDIIGRLAYEIVRPAMAGDLLDIVDSALADLPTRGYDAPDAVLRALGEPVPDNLWSRPADPRLGLASFALHLLSTWFVEGRLTPAQEARLWAALRFLDEPLGRHDPATDATVGSSALADALGVPLDSPLARIPVQPNRWPVDVRVLLTAYRQGHATRDDVVSQLVGYVRSESFGHASGGMRELTSRRPPSWLADDPAGQALVTEVCAAALDIERQRDDLDTTASAVVRAICSTQGIDVLFGYLAALGKRPFVRGYSWSGGREPALCGVIRMVEPGPDDTVEGFRVAAAAAGIGERRLVELGVYAPHWASYVEATLDWPGYADAVWWLHAHTKGDDWSVDPELRKEWEAEVARRTPLDAVDLMRGAADVAFYRASIDLVGEERFGIVLKAAKLASSSGGHKRAELFADALAGRVTAAELVARITGKRHQDAVRALGLVPLAGRADLLARYELLAGWVAGDRTSGSQRRASETLAVQLGIENLARTAGYRDPQRLVWAMEAAAVADLVDGEVAAVDGDLRMTLAIVDGAPATAVTRAGKALAALPRSHAKHPSFVALRERATRLRKQASRMRASLEVACVAGEEFGEAEVAELYGHPLLRPMLTELVAVAADGRCGFFGDQPGELVLASGEQIGAELPVRIAHPHDLLGAGAWPDLQHVLFTARRRQPFRQLFRELYVVTDSERTDRGWSRRYAGHQVQPRQAAGLFRSRGWVADFESGFAKTFHTERITAVATLLNGCGSPTEVEDGQLDLVAFQRPGSFDVLALEEVPPRLFSEVMRDLDLVVSVAHSGGVDPETSASAVEVRGRLVAETADLLGLTNIEITPHHALVKGRLGSYSVNLGSGVVHRQPGNAVCIVPVHAQQRGRVFLPFVDDDPRTAEVISKVVLLARDDKIQDPTILDQLRR